MIDERELREMLERRAATISATPTDVPKAIRRARRRVTMNAGVGALVGLAVLAGALAGVRAIQAAPTPADPPTPAPPPARAGVLAYALDGDIFVAEWDGSNRVRIADGRPPRAHGESYRPNVDCGVSEFGTGEYSAEGAMWSPDGRYLAYRHADCDGRPGEWSDVVISDAEGNVVTTFPSEGWGISWSPDSTRVVVWERWGEEDPKGDGGATIGVYGLDGVRQTLLTVPPGMGSSGETDPMWSPDGESIVLFSGLAIPLDGSTPGLLPWVDRGIGGWRYSPDGSRLALAVDRSLVVAEADGSNPQEVFGDWPGAIVWSPAGDRIAFGDDELRVLDLTTGTVTSLVDADTSELLSIIDFSPEGDRLLFSRMGDGSPFRRSLWSVNADGSDLRRLVAGTAWGDWFWPG